jgi:hypothetical protein
MRPRPQGLASRAQVVPVAAAGGVGLKKGRTLSIGTHEEGEELVLGSPLHAAIAELGGLDSFTIGPQMWDVWAHLLAQLRRLERFLAAPPLPTAGAQPPRLDVGPLPIGRLGARARGGNETYPPWHRGGCAPGLLTQGSSVATVVRRLITRGPRGVPVEKLQRTFSNLLASAMEGAVENASTAKCKDPLPSKPANLVHLKRMIAPGAARQSSAAARRLRTRTRLRAALGSRGSPRRRRSLSTPWRWSPTARSC